MDAITLCGQRIPYDLARKTITKMLPEVVKRHLVCTKISDEGLPVATIDWEHVFTIPLARATVITNKL